MKVVLIDPRGVWEGLNNGLAYIAAAIRNKNDVVVIDFVNKQGSIKKRMESVKDAEIIGISVKSFTLLESIKIANIAKKMNNRALIVAGGPHIIVDGYNFLKENAVFDVAISGEAEIAFKELVEKKPKEEISGLIYREKEKIVQNPKREWIQDLGSLPFPVYDDFDSIKDTNKIQNWPLVTSRGCPYTCTYCNVPTVIGRKFRTRSKESLLKELRYAHEKYGSKEFKVLDDNFTLNMGRAKDICRFFIEEKLDMKWTCPNGIRADRLDNELCELMHKAGCYSVSIGVESGDPEVFLKIRKGERLEDVERGIKTAQKAGLKVHGFFILGLVGSTYETDKKSMEFAKKMGITASWGILVPYPGTEVWNQINDSTEYRIIRDWKEGFHIGARPKPVFDTKKYPAEERVKAFYKANMMFLKKKDIPKVAKIMIKGLMKR